MPRRSVRTPDLGDLLPSWELSLRAERKSPQTIKTYTDGVHRNLAWCAENNLDAGWLESEITENTVMQDMEVIIPKLKELRRLGVQIAIDDFGTGYSSLSYLQQFPIQTLKIDRSFVGDIREDETDASIVNAIVAMARGLKLDLIAEGVENRTQLRYLHAQGCSEGQGYMFSRPVPANDISNMIRRNPFVELVREGTADADAPVETV